MKDDVLHLDGRQITAALYTYRKGKSTFQTTIANVTLLLPSRIFAKLDLKTSAGSISLKKISCKTANLETAYGDVDLRLKNACLDGLGIQAKVMDGNLAVGKVFGGSKKKVGDFGWVFVKPANGNAQIDIIVNCGDISIKAVSRQ